MPWIFTHSVQIAKQVSTQYGARGASDYGSVYVYDQTKPSEPAAFKGSLIDDTEFAALLAAIRLPMSEAGNLVTLSVQGVNWQGNIINLTGTRIMGSVYREVEVTLFDAAIV